LLDNLKASAASYRLQRISQIKAKWSWGLTLWLQKER